MKSYLIAGLGAVVLSMQLVGQPLTQAYPGYAVSVAGSPGSAPDAGFLPLIWGKLDTLNRQQRDSRFGILFRGATQDPAGSLVFTFIDAATGSSIHEMTMAQYRGEAGEGIRPLPQRSSSNDSTRIDAFMIEKAGRSFTAIRTVARHTDASMPTGSFLALSWTIESATAFDIRIVLNGRAEGIVTTRDNALHFSPAPAFSFFRPELVVVGDAGSQAAADAPTATLTGPVVTVPAGQATPVFTLRVFGTAVTVTDFASQQADNIVALLNGAAASPAMVTRTMVSKATPAPGDTITYRILFHNVGTAPATGIVLTNPIGQGLTYVPGSATGRDADIAIGQSDPEPPQAPVVQDITWTFTSNILPGDERWVSFKAIVQ